MKERGCFLRERNQAFHQALSPEYLFEDNGQRLISRRETHRYGKAKYKRGELKTEKEMWAAFKQELDDMPIRDVINIPHKYLKLYLWKYPVRIKLFD